MELHICARTFRNHTQRLWFFYLTNPLIKPQAAYTKSFFTIAIKEVPVGSRKAEGSKGESAIYLPSA